MKKTNLVNIPIGDWSDDGHGKFQNFIFEVPSEFTKEVLIESYRRNKEKFQFGLADFARDYEDCTIPKEKVRKLIAAGLDTSDFELLAEEDNVYLSVDDMFQIAIFFIGHGLEGFNYRMAPEPDFTLFASWQGPETSIGYGLFY